MNYLGYVLAALLVIYVFDFSGAREKNAEQRETATLRATLKEKAGPPSDVSFTWQLPERARPGETITVAVEARQRGHALAVECELNGARSVTRLNAAVLNWTPTAPGSVVMACSAGGRTDMRLLAAGKI